MHHSRRSRRRLAVALMLAKYKKNVPVVTGRRCQASYPVRGQILLISLALVRDRKSSLILKRSFIKNVSNFNTYIRHL